MINGTIEKTQKISSKVTKFIWFHDMCNFLKSDKYCEIEGAVDYKHSSALHNQSASNLDFKKGLKVYPKQMSHTNGWHFQVLSFLQIFQYRVICFFY